MTRQVGDLVSDAVLWFEAGGRLVHANLAACRLLRSSREELLARTASEIDPRLAAALGPARCEGPQTFEATDGWAEPGSPPSAVTVHHLEAEGDEIFLALIRSPQPESAAQSPDDRYRSLFENLPIGLYQSRPDGRLTEVNPAMVQMLGYPDRASLLAVNATDLWVDPEERLLMQKQLAATGVLRDCEAKLYHHDGTIIWARLNTREIRDPATGSPCYEGSVQEITERRRILQGLEQSERRFRSLVQNVSDMISVISPEGVVLYESPAHERVLGYRPQTRVGQTVVEKIHPDDRTAVLEALRTVLEKPNATLSIGYRYLHADGSWRFLESVGTNLVDDPAVGGIVVNTRDITDRKRVEEQLRHLALHDSLTGLPNRTLFLDRLETAIQRAERHPGWWFAVLFLDLDRFKVINDSLGHTIGDQALVTVGELLRDHLHATDSVARVGGDEFLILLEELPAAESAIEVAQRLHRLLEQPLHLSGHEVFTTLSIGIAPGRRGAHSAEDLLREADTALHRAKAKGGGAHVVFDSSMHRLALERLEVESGLRRALDQGELTAVYQPILALASEHIVGVEALVRWQHPTRGLLIPAQFLGLAEETGLVGALDRRVLEVACRQLRRWRETLAASEPLTLCTNLSQKTLSQAASLRRLEELLQELELKPDHLVLEITEGSLFESTEAAARVLRRVKQLSVRLALDDFGTGFSSLAHLHRLPIDILKIDRSFVGRIHRDREIPAIVMAIIRLGRSLGLDVVAEGIESAEQARALRELGCSYGQGTYYSAPLPASEIEAVLAGRIARWPSS